MYLGKCIIWRRNVVDDTKKKKKEKHKMIALNVLINCIRSIYSQLCCWCQTLTQLGQPRITRYMYLSLIRCSFLRTQQTFRHLLRWIEIIYEVDRVRWARQRCGRCKTKSNRQLIVVKNSIENHTEYHEDEAKEKYIECEWGNLIPNA